LFAYLRGVIESKELTGASSDRVVIDVAGFGIEVQVSRRTLLTMGQLNQEVRLPVALAIRENDWTIFGFASVAEKELFALLQSVTGIGPKLALALVGTFAPADLAQAIIDEDQKMITQAPGVGAKVAQRIILELKSRIEDWQEKHAAVKDTEDKAITLLSDEVRSILSGLGYTTTEVNMALSEARNANVGEDVESLVRYSLKTLGSPVSN
jgi:Holliday junction DNA helicase RuvA